MRIAAINAVMKNYLVLFLELEFETIHEVFHGESASKATGLVMSMKKIELF